MGNINSKNYERMKKLIKNKIKVKDIFGILKNRMKRNTYDLLQEVDSDFE
jgi:hypothetical protein